MATHLSITCEVISRNNWRHNYPCCAGINKGVFLGGRAPLEAACALRARRLAASDPYLPDDPRRGRQVYRAGRVGIRKKTVSRRIRCGSHRGPKSLIYSDARALAGLRNWGEQLHVEHQLGLIRAVGIAEDVLETLVRPEGLVGRWCRTGPAARLALARIESELG